MSRSVATIFLLISSITRHFSKEKSRNRRNDVQVDVFRKDSNQLLLTSASQALIC